MSEQGIWQSLKRKLGLSGSALTPSQKTEPESERWYKGDYDELIEGHHYQVHYATSPDHARQNLYEMEVLKYNGLNSKFCNHSECKTHPARPQWIALSQSDNVGLMYDITIVADVTPEELK